MLSGFELYPRWVPLYFWSLRNTENKNKRKGAGERSEWGPLFIQIGYFRTMFISLRIY